MKYIGRIFFLPYYLFIIYFTLIVFEDVNTKIPVDDSYLFSKAALKDHVYMDAMGFGMGCCCLQLTFQACNITEARTLYDQLAPLCPVMVSTYL